MYLNKVLKELSRFAKEVLSKPEVLNRAGSFVPKMIVICESIEVTKVEYNTILSTLFKDLGSPRIWLI